MRILRHLVTQEQEGRMVKSVARGEMHLSYGQFKRLKYANGILVDGAPVHADVRLMAGQVLEIRFQDEGQKIIPHEMPLSVLYEDEDYLVVDKPAPLPTLPSVHQEGLTLENVVFAYLKCPEDFIYRPVNRLDKGTSGLMAIAKNAHSQQLLQKMLHADAFIREYLAVCRGIPGEKEGVIDLPIGKMGEGVKREIRPDGKRAVTHYRVEKEGKENSLIRLRLETGRTHQIRVHMQALGCPVAGDYLYGSEDERLPGRFALHSARILFYHPVKNVKIDLEAPPPPVFQALLD